MICCDEDCWLSPRGEAELSCLLDVQVVAVEQVFMGGATHVDARVVGARPENQQTEQTDGESAPQVCTVRDLTGIQELVSMVIGQGSGLFKAAQTFRKEPYN